MNFSSARHGSLSPTHRLTDVIRFNRIWVVQELAYARVPKATVGARCIQFEALWTAAAVINELQLQENLVPPTEMWVAPGIEGQYSIEQPPAVPEAIAIQLQAIHIILGINFKGSKNLKICEDMLKLLVLTRGFQSSDPRDKLFAVLGLCLQEDLSKLPIRYNLTTADVYKAFAATKVVSERDLRYLFYTSCSSEDEPRLLLPTWVTDWSRKAERYQATLTTSQFNALGNREPDVKASDDLNILTIKGYVVAEIVQLNTYLIEEYFTIPNVGKSDDYKAVKWCFDWLEECLTIALGELNEGGWTEIPAGAFRKVWRTISMESNFLIGTEDVPDRLLEDLHHNLSKALQDWEGFSIVSVDRLHSAKEFTKQLQDQIRMLSACVLEVSHDRRLCRTNIESIGMVPKKTQVGDLVCVFDGGAIPCILRRCQLDGFELIGSCYIDGTMHGESDTMADLEQRYFQIQ